MTTPGQPPVAEAAERSHLALRRAVVDVAMSLVRAGVLSHSGHADLSARVGPDAVLIATLNPTRDLVPDDLAVIRLDGTVAEGDATGMSTEVVATHTEVYRVRPQTGAVIHTHSPHLLAFALAGRPLPVRYVPLSHLGQAEEVPVAPSASAAAELIGARPGTQAVLLGGHGVLAFGPDAETAVSLLVALEEAAEAELRTAVLGRLSAAARDIAHLGDGRRERCVRQVAGYRAVLRPGLQLARSSPPRSASGAAWRSCPCSQEPGAAPSGPGHAPSGRPGRRSLTISTEPSEGVSMAMAWWPSQTTREEGRAPARRQASYLLMS